MDERAIADFVATDYGRVVSIVTLVCGSQAGAEDAVQDAMVKAWGRDDIETPAAWILAVALNGARSALRRLWAEQRARDRLRPGAASPGSEAAMDVQRALRRLTRRQREVTVLRYYAGLDVAEIAEALGVSTGTVKTLLSRGRDTLSAALADSYAWEAGCPASTTS